jgi:hypothetical protein
MVLGAEKKMPDDNLQLCVIVYFLFGFRLMSLAETYHIFPLVI